MSDPTVAEPAAIAEPEPRARPHVTQLLTIAGVIVVTVAAVVLIFKALGPDVRPASTPVGWSGVYGNDFALALPNDFDTSTAPADLDSLEIPGLQMVAGKGGTDQQDPDAAVLIVTQPGTAEAFATSVLGKGQVATPTSLSGGDALTADASIAGASGRVWFVERGDHAWAVMVLVREGGPYDVADLGSKIADSFQAA